MATVYNINRRKVEGATGDRYHEPAKSPRDSRDRLQEVYRAPSSSHSKTPNTHQVGFSEPVRNPYGCYQVQDERKKYLTAKYGQHQMKLIRKRLAVESWVDSQLRILYDADEDDNYDCEIDLDELLDLDEERDRRLFLQKNLANVTKSPEVVRKFVEELLEKAQTL